MMRTLSIVAAVAGLLIGTTSLGYAQSSTQDRAPGQRMQERGSVPGHPGASGYAPGQRMHERGSKAGEPGASGYAPGRQAPETTGREAWVTGIPIAIAATPAEDGDRHVRETGRTAPCGPSLRMAGMNAQPVPYEPSHPRRFNCPDP